MAAYAELHCHTNFSFLDGASAPDELAERAVELGLTGLGGHRPPGPVRRRPVGQTAVRGGRAPAGHRDRGRAARSRSSPIPAGSSSRRGRSRRGAAAGGRPAADGRRRTRPPPARASRIGRARSGPGCPAIARRSRRTCAGSASAQRGPHLVLLARDAIGYRSLCRLVSRANLAGTKAMPRFDQALLAEHTEGLVALSGCREGEIARRLRVGDREGARARGARSSPSGYGRDAFLLELSHHLLPDDDWLVTETVALADELGLPVVVTNDVHYALPEGRELQDVLTAIRHGRTLETLGRPAPARRRVVPEVGGRAAALPPGDGSLGRDVARAWAEGIGPRGRARGRRARSTSASSSTASRASRCRRARRRSRTSRSCAGTGARRRYHPLTSAVVNRLAHELDVIERAGLAEFFLICWDLMRFAKEQGIPAQGRGSAAELDRRRTRSGSAGSSRSSTTCCSSGSSTRAGRPTRTSTSTSRPSGARRSSSTSTAATARSTRGWSATS